MGEYRLRSLTEKLVFVYVIQTDHQLLYWRIHRRYFSLNCIYISRLCFHTLNAFTVDSEKFSRLSYFFRRHSFHSHHKVFEIFERLVCSFFEFVKFHVLGFEIEFKLVLSFCYSFENIFFWLVNFFHNVFNVIFELSYPSGMSLQIASHIKIFVTLLYKFEV